MRSATRAGPLRTSTVGGLPPVPIVANPLLGHRPLSHTPGMVSFRQAALLAVGAVSVVGGVALLPVAGVSDPADWADPARD